MMDMSSLILSTNFSSITDMLLVLRSKNFRTNERYRERGDHIHIKLAARSIHSLPVVIKLQYLRKL